MSGFGVKIASVGGPATTPDSSGLAYCVSQFPIIELLSKQYNVTSFTCEKARSLKLTNARKIHVFAGFTWLPFLSFHLLKDRFHLFMTSLFHLGTIATFISSKLMKKPLLVLDEHWYWRRNLLMVILWPIVRLIACNATLLIVSGIRSRKFWEIAGVPNEKIRIVHFDISLIEPEERHVNLSNKIRKSLGNKKVLLYFGRLVKRKGVDILIRAFAELSEEDPDLVLIIAGKGEERKPLVRLCEELGVDGRVHFAGLVDEDDKAAYFLSCDVFVCPSITLDMPEIWGLVVNEAMSIGKPVIVTTAVGSGDDLVKHNLNGYIIPENSVSALYGAMKTIISDEKLRNNMGKASREIVEQKFTYHHALESFNKAIDSVLSCTSLNVKR